MYKITVNNTEIIVNEISQDDFVIQNLNQYAANMVKANMMAHNKRGTIYVKDVDAIARIYNAAPRSVLWLGMNKSFDHLMLNRHVDFVSGYGCVVESAFLLQPEKQPDFFYIILKLEKKDDRVYVNYYKIKKALLSHEMRKYKIDALL